MILLKFSGIVLIIISSSLFGLYKAHGLSKRKKMLGELINSLSCLSEQIRCNGGELRSIMPLCFDGCNEIKWCEKGIITDGLSTMDKTIVDDLFLSLGTADSVVECERIARCVALLERQYSQAQADCEQKTKIWQCFGISVGLAISIFLI